MRAATVAALGLLLAPVLGQASSKSALGPIAVLWIPAENPDLAGLQDLLARHPEVKIAVGVVPELVAESSAAAIAQLWRQGRVEPVLRLEGDPILPLRPVAHRELPPRLALARRSFEQRFGRAPSGFAPGGGALDEACALALRRTGLRWSAVGARVDGEAPYLVQPPGPGSESPGSSGEALIAVGGRAFSDAAAAAAHGGLVVIDEGSGLTPEGSGLAAIEALARNVGGTRSWALPLALGPARGTGEPDPGRSWNGDLSPWNGRAAQRQALRRLDEAAAALDRYQNSGAAVIGVLDQASALLRSAEGSRRLARAQSEAAPLEDSLTRLYLLIGEAPPDDLASSSAAAHSAGLVSAEAAPGLIVFANPRLEDGGT